MNGSFIRTSKRGLSARALVSGPVVSRGYSQVSDTVPTLTRGGCINSCMVNYTFRIRQEIHSSDIPINLVDDDAAWNEAAGACSDMIRDTIARLGDSPEWRLEDADGSGTILHPFRLTAETVDK